MKKQITEEVIYIHHHRRRNVLDKITLSSKILLLPQKSYATRSKTR